eukprot:Rmarinus@m.18513
MSLEELFEQERKYQYTEAEKEALEEFYRKVRESRNVYDDAERTNLEISRPDIYPRRQKVKKTTCSAPCSERDHMFRSLAEEIRDSHSAQFDIVPTPKRTRRTSASASLDGANSPKSPKHSHCHSHSHPPHTGALRSKSKPNVDHSRLGPMPRQVAGCHLHLVSSFARGKSMDPVWFQAPPDRPTAASHAKTSSKHPNSTNHGRQKSRTRGKNSHRSSGTASRSQSWIFSGIRPDTTAALKSSHPPFIVPVKSKESTPHLRKTPRVPQISPGFIAHTAPVKPCSSCVEVRKSVELKRKVKKKRPKRLRRHSLPSSDDVVVDGETLGDKGVRQMVERIRHNTFMQDSEDITLANALADLSLVGQNIAVPGVSQASLHTPPAPTSPSGWQKQLGRIESDEKKDPNQQEARVRTRTVHYEDEIDSKEILKSSQARHLALLNETIEKTFREDYAGDTRVFGSPPAKIQRDVRSILQGTAQDMEDAQNTTKPSHRRPGPRLAWREIGAEGEVSIEDTFRRLGVNLDSEDGMEASLGRLWSPTSERRTSHTSQCGSEVSHDDLISEHQSEITSSRNDDKRSTGQCDAPSSYQDIDRTLKTSVGDSQSSALVEENTQQHQRVASRQPWPETGVNVLSPQSAAREWARVTWSDSSDDGAEQAYYRPKSSTAVPRKNRVQSRTKTSRSVGKPAANVRSEKRENKPNQGAEKGDKRMKLRSGRGQVTS